MPIQYARLGAASPSRHFGLGANGRANGRGDGRFVAERHRSGPAEGVDGGAFDLGVADRAAASTYRSSASARTSVTNDDPLSDVLHAVRLTGGVFVSAHFTAPWCVSVSVTPEDCAPFLGRPIHVIGYHVVVEGRLLLGLEEEPSFEVRAGEIVLFPHNDPHTLASAQGIRPVSARKLIRPCPEADLPRIRHGGGGAATRIVCGFLASEETYNPLFATLPKVLKIDFRDAASRGWIEASVQFAASEMAQGRLASSSVITRLSELLLIEAVRQYSSTLPEEEVGWLNGLKDPQIGRAVALIHHKLDQPWSAQALAKEVALSRSAFVERFTSLVGTPPIRYLTGWRLRTARQTLRETSKTISQVAHAVGYESEEAFSRAFKREFGLPPARWRDQNAIG
jgi:AraC-like DNA-binding protein